MIMLDQYILHIFVFCPLIASIFIMLIPASDLGSKLAASKFFALFGFFAYLRLMTFFLDQSVPTEVILSLGSAYFRVNLTLFISKFNMILYGIASIVLLYNTFTYDINNAKTNIHHVTPFVLTFVIFISFSQNDLRVALPILSIANFLVYFIIGSFDSVRRGFTIFQMGVFIFSCDALALVLLQIPQKNFSEGTQPMFFAIILLPAFARLCMPMLAPFAKKLFLNTNNIEGSFLIIFEQMAGFFVLHLVKADLNEISRPLFIFIVLATTLGIIYAGFSAIIDKNISIMPHYFLVFYSSIAVTTAFISKDNSMFNAIMSLYSTNIICFFCLLRFFEFYNTYPSENRLLAHKILYYIGISMFIGVPGIGVGNSLWYLIFDFVQKSTLLNMPWMMVTIVVIWLFVLTLLGIAMIVSIMNTDSLANFAMSPNSAYRMQPYMLFAPVLIMIASWLIPWGIFFLAAQGL